MPERHKKQASVKAHLFTFGIAVLVISWFIDGAINWQRKPFFTIIYCMYVWEQILVTFPRIVFKTDSSGMLQRAKPLTSH